MTRFPANIAAFSASPHARAAGLRRGFTLVEVMVAIAIALALIVGISQIFALAQKTTGGGTTLVKNNITQRSIQSQLRQDFQNVAIDPQSPGFVITSQSAAAFRNKADHDQSRDTGNPPDPRVFNDPGSGGPLPLNVGGLPNMAFSTNSRIHRLDRLCMFERGTYHRQTADAPNLTSQTTSQEAFVWYGHLAALNDAGIASFDPDHPDTPLDAANGAYMNPGAPTFIAPPKNNNNEYASSWVLGRQQIVLLPKKSDTNENMFRPLLTGVSPVPLSILQKAPVLSSASIQVPMFSSRYDLSLSTIADCRFAFANQSSGAVQWWEQISGLQFNIGATNIFADQRYLTNVYPTKPARYQGNTGYQGSWLSAASALTAPVFVRNCSQFIVEYAGNYVTQDQDSSPGNANFGQVKAPSPDPSGKLDFIPIKDSNNNWTRQIRWYGFPRDTASIDPNTGIASTGSDAQIDGGPGTTYITHDVIPLSMFIRAAGFGDAIYMPKFERNWNAFSTYQIPMKSGGDFPFQNTSYSNPSLPIISVPYICAWGPDTDPSTLPKLIRITIAIDDPNGRLNNEQTFEYIFALSN